MQTKCSVYLNGIGLHELDDSIILQTIEESAPNISLITQARRVGTYENGKTRPEMSVKITFCISIKKDYAERVRILQAVNEWAYNGGILRLDYREGQQMHVVCASLPNVGYVRQWTGKYELVFKALGVPFWEADSIDSVNGRGTAYKGTMTNRGTAETPLMLFVDNTNSQPLKTLTVKANGKQIQFVNLDVQPGERFVMQYIRGLQDISIVGTDGRTRSGIGKRTVESADDLWLTPGANAVEFAANRSMTYTLATRGRWL